MIAAKSIYARWRLLACLVVVILRNNNEGVYASNVFDWKPSISLTNNFDVPEGLCLDIAGFGANLNCDAIMQLHTCKAQGADTQFVFDYNTNEIRSVNYDSDCQSIENNKNSLDGACVTVDGSLEVGTNLRLSFCNRDILQHFEVTIDGKIRTKGNFDLCLAKTSDVGPAGSNERTDFALADCESSDPADTTWSLKAPIDATATIVSDDSTDSTTASEDTTEDVKIGSDDSSASIPTLKILISFVVISCMDIAAILGIQ